MVIEHITENKLYQGIYKTNDRGDICNECTSFDKECKELCTLRILGIKKYRVSGQRTVYANLTCRSFKTKDGNNNA